MHFSNSTLVILLVLLILIAMFFALAETAMLSINRYRLRHLAKHHHRTAKIVQQLLDRPDRLLGIILLCNTFANIFASAIATLIAIHYFGQAGVMLATVGLTLLILIMGEVTPKTLAALYPQPLAFISAWPLFILLKILYPFIWIINAVANGLLRLVGIKVGLKAVEHLSHDELRTVLDEAGSKIPTDYQNMLLKVLDLGKVTIEDIMIPRNEIIGIDLNDEWERILEQLTNSQHTRLLIYNGDIDQVVGILHLRKALNLLAQERLTKESLIEATDKCYFVPASTSLNVQLLNFRREKQRTGVVVSEYGDLQGLVTLEDILEEIVGEFTTDISTTSKSIHPQSDGSYLVDGTTSLRELNHLLKYKFPLTGPKTLSGLIIEYLETIPQAGTALRLAGYPMEILQVKDNVIKTVKIIPLSKNNNSETLTQK